MKLLLILTFAAIAYGQEVTPKVPVIPPAAAAEFWRAQAMFLSIAPEYRRLEEAMKAEKAKLDAICGKNFTLADNNGLVCVSKPEKEPKK